MVPGETKQGRLGEGIVLDFHEIPSKGFGAKLLGSHSRAIQCFLESVEVRQHSVLGLGTRNKAEGTFFGQLSFAPTLSGLLGAYS